MADWNPDLYARFAGLRRQPALDLLARVGALPSGDVIDLGCGNGAVGPVLATRFPDRARLGVDLSPAMLAQARDGGHYTVLHEADLTQWRPDAPPALIFSNAALNWVPDHATLIARLVGMLAAGGMLAVQVPAQHDEPSHAMVHDIARDLAPDVVTTPQAHTHVRAPCDYAELLAPMGEANVWTTQYMQRLDPVGQGHPVRHFTQSTYLRRYLDLLESAQLADAFLDRYDTALFEAYPPDESGAVWFPFKRLFFTLRTGA
ncbi:methyltransferase domain-containing protein [Celeribacter arenosi]|uniref:Methyltransferase domain-containing protein n=1 Tax=Celeribacter arenosi TaxID=792649 RepID=A0ABP7KA57_9RHOB